MQIFDTLIQAIQSHQNQTLLILATVVILLFLFNIIVAIFTFKAYRLQKKLFGDTDKENLKEILSEHINRVGVVQVKLNDLDKIVAEMKRQGLTHVQKIGIVRFNPFSDTGSDQSFVIAILNGDDDGLVISSLHGRDRTRIYSKEVKAGGEADYPFSDEEREAIERARRR
ncbi:MAG: DUF4446 family protein [Candidatus Cloacimonetes bacterium]|nr:DUF4446 family protein [Candidatus Cloacimonadota bacterium]